VVVVVVVDVVGADVVVVGAVVVVLVVVMPVVVGVSIGVGVVGAVVVVAVGVASVVEGVLSLSNSPGVEFASAGEVSGDVASVVGAAVTVTVVISVMGRRAECSSVCRWLLADCPMSGEKASRSILESIVGSGATADPPLSMDVRAAISK
jgi:hypothetical protein